MKFILSLVGFVVMTGCCLALSASSGYDVPILSDAELAVATQKACESARKKKQNVLIEFTAEWCGDCVELHAMKQRGKLKEEVQKWDSVAINVGEFKNHTALLKHFGIRAIADWRVLSPPQKCDLPITKWPAIGNRIMEPRSGAPVSGEELASWLEKRRLYKP